MPPLNSIEKSIKGTYIPLLPPFQCKFSINEFMPPLSIFRSALVPFLLCKFNVTLIIIVIFIVKVIGVNMPLVLQLYEYHKVSHECLCLLKAKQIYTAAVESIAPQQKKSCYTRVVNHV